MVPQPVITPSPRIRRSSMSKFGRPVQGEHVELGERTGVEHPVDALTPRELALGVLRALGSAGPVDRVVPPFAQHVDLSYRCRLRIHSSMLHPRPEVRGRRREATELLAPTGGTPLRACLVTASGHQGDRMPPRVHTVTGGR